MQPRLLLKPLKSSMKVSKGCQSIHKKLFGNSSFISFLNKGSLMKTYIHFNSFLPLA